MHTISHVHEINRPGSIQLTCSSAKKTGSRWTSRRREFSVALVQAHKSCRKILPGASRRETVAGKSLKQETDGKPARKQRASPEETVAGESLKQETETDLPKFRDRPKRRLTGAGGPHHRQRGPGICGGLRECWNSHSFKNAARDAGGQSRWMVVAGAKLN